MSESYAEVKARLDEIVEAVADENLPLDEALALYEEAVKLGNKVSSLIETDIAMNNEQNGESDESIGKKDQAEEAAPETAPEATPETAPEATDSETIPDEKANQ